MDPSVNQTYEHIKDPGRHHDDVTLDAATEEQMQEQPRPNKEEEKAAEMDKDNDQMDMLEDEDQQKKVWAFQCYLILMLLAVMWFAT